MSETFSEFAKLISGIFGENRLGKILALVSIIGVGILGLFLWDALTGDFTLRAIERKISLLASLNELEQAGVAKSPTLSALYQALTDELAGYKPTLVTVSGTISPNALQFLGGIGIWLFMAIMIAAGNTSNKATTFGAAVALGVLLGIGGMFVPDSLDPLTNLLYGFGMQILFLFIIYLWTSIRRRVTTVRK